jgi:putative flippase GtrA
MEEPRVSHRRSVPIYIGAGGIATGSHYAVTIAGVEILHVEPLVASVAGFAVGATVKYWLNYSIAFRSNARHTVALGRYVVTLALMMAGNAAIFAALQSGLKMHYLVAQVLTTILLIPPGYVIHRRWVFR